MTNEEVLKLARSAILTYRKLARKTDLVPPGGYFNPYDWLMEKAAKQAARNFERKHKRPR